MAWSAIIDDCDKRRSEERIGDTAFHLHGVSQERSGRVVLRDLDIAIPRGRVSVLLGASGSGKTSLLRLLNRLDDPTAGEIVYEGRPVTFYRVTDLRSRVAFVFQTPVMFPGTVRANLAEAARIHEIPDSAFGTRAERVMATSELDRSLLERDGRELSLGEQQRVNLARALIHKPEVLLLDEPTSALDPDTSARLLRTVRRLCRDEGLTIVMATHRVEEARQVGDFAVVLRDGRVLQTGDGP